MINYPVNLIISLIILTLFSIGLFIRYSYMHKQSIIVTGMLSLCIYVLIGNWSLINQYYHAQTIQSRILNTLTDPNQLIALLQRQINREPNDKKAYHILSKLLKAQNRDIELLNLHILYNQQFSEELLIYEI